MEIKEFGARLRELRKQAGFSQRELADMTGINFTYLSKIESGAMPPPSEKILSRLAEVLKVDKDELMTLAGKIPPDIAQILKSRETLQFLRSDRIQKRIRATKKKERTNMMKNLADYKKLSRVAIAIVLVSAVAASLWFASPTKALTIGITNPPSGTLGSNYSFQVQVDIEDPEHVPIQNITLELYNAALPATYKATCTNLPLTDGSSKSYSNSATGGGGTVGVTASAPHWEWLQNAGYAVWQNQAYYFPTKGDIVWGYGYQAGTATITYTINWTPPLGWPQGSYLIKAQITANGTTFTQLSSTFTLTAAGGGGGFGGGGVLPPPPPPPGVTDVSDYVTTEGVFVQEVIAESEDGKVELTIGEGTTGLTEEGEPVSEISITEMEEPLPEPPADSEVIGLIYKLGPEGTTFSPAITVTFTYDPNDLPAGINEENLVIAIWDEDAGEAGEWVVLENITVDTVNHTISATVSHFTPFAVIAYTSPPVFVTSDLTISATEVEAGQSVAIHVLVTNTGDLSGSYQVTLWLENVAVGTQDVTLAGGASQGLTFIAARDVPGTYTINIEGLSATFTVKEAVTPPDETEPEPAEFTPSNLFISPAEVGIGETVTVSILVANTGDLTDSYEVTLKVDNVAIATRDVILAGGTSQTVSFTTTEDTAGTYTVDVNGLSDTFTVKTLVVPMKPINWGLITGIIAGAAVVIGVVIWLAFRRRQAFI
jgi:transcriptional regulator with XRE-family HTH domain